MGKRARRVAATACAVMLMIAAASAWPDGVSSPENGGAVISAGAIQAAVRIPAPGGREYLIYLEKGGLSAQLSSDGGASFQPYAIDFSGNTLTSFSLLTMLGRAYRHPLALFAADENGVSSLYALTVDGNGNLSLLSSAPLSNPSYGSVSSYSVHPLDRNSFFVTYEAGKLLRYTLVTDTNGVPTPQGGTLSQDGSPVEGYGVLESPGPTGNTLYGYFRSAASGGATTLSVFSMHSGSLPTVSVLDSHPGGPNESIATAQDSNGAVHLAWADGGTLYQYSESDGVWAQVGSVGIPLAAYNVLGEPLGQTVVYCISAAGQNGGLYLEPEGRSALLPVAGANPVESAPGLTPLLASGELALSYLSEASGAKVMRGDLYAGGTGGVTGTPFPSPAGSTILAAATGYLVDVVLSSGSAGEVVDLYGFNPAAGSFARALQVPLPAGLAPTSLRMSSLKEPVIVIDLGTGKVVVNLQTGAYDINPEGNGFVSVGTASVPFEYIEVTPTGSLLMKVSG